MIAASISVSEEIEGRTAVTVMSKPISRRQFLLGKFGGLLLASLLMTILLGWFLVWIVVYKSYYDRPMPNTQEALRRPIRPGSLNGPMAGFRKAAWRTWPRASAFG